MNEEEMTGQVVRALEAARTAWDRAHRGLPASIMTKAAAIPATGILAATLLDQLDEDDRRITSRAEAAIRIARRAWERTHRETAGNPIAMTAERSVIGILAAGILNREHAARARRSGPRTKPLVVKG